MDHDWVFDVLEDLKSYAVANGLMQLAGKAEEALKVASAEIAALEMTGSARPSGHTSH